MDDIQEIDHMPRNKSRASFILKSVDNSLGAECTNNFYKLLNIMEGLHNDDVKAIVRDIRRALVTGEHQTTINPHAGICSYNILLAIVAIYRLFSYVYNHSYFT